MKVVSTISTYNSKSRKNVREKEEDFNLWEPNLRGMMASFYIGSGPDDVRGALSFMGIPGGHSWKHIFIRIWMN